MHFSLQDIATFANLILVPVVGLLWNIQGRISKIEGAMSKVNPNGK